ncbi:hypothetical protein LJK87_35475 [Paenibacillus sp. P25]|nr:hypothetical protein LJK87_35475 [Paenibacillus sp. P25]
MNRPEDLVAAMYAKMEYYAERLEYEKADNMLRHIRILERMPEKQIVDRESTLDQDVLYFGEDRVLLAKVQEGMLRDFEFLPLDPGGGGGGLRPLHRLPLPGPAAGRAHREPHRRPAPGSGGAARQGREADQDYAAKTRPEVRSAAAMQGQLRIPHDA